MMSLVGFLEINIIVIASRALALRGEAIPELCWRLLRAEEHCPRNDGSE
jgi:hypothetical protein